MLIGMPSGGLEALFGRAQQEERNRFKADPSLLPQWKEMLALEEDPQGLIIYARMINSSREDGADVVEFIGAVIDRYRKLIEQDEKRTSLQKASVLLGEFGLTTANYAYIKRFAESFKPLVPSVAFMLHSHVRSDSFGGREAKDAVFRAIPEELQIAFDVYRQAYR